MPRKARIDHAGLTHHIMARTFDNMLLFLDDDDRSFYRSCLAIARYQREGLSLDDVLREISRTTGINESLLRVASKRTPQAAARKIFCYCARELQFPTREIGRFLGIGQAAASNIFLIAFPAHTGISV